MEQAVLHYAKHLTPLSNQSIPALAEYMLDFSTSDKDNCNEKKVSKSWVNGFLKRHPQLKVFPMQYIENPRTAGATREHIAEHIARVQCAIEIYAIKSLNFKFNIDESGISFKRLLGCKRRYAVGPRAEKIVHTVANTVGKLDHVTMMSVVTTMGRVYEHIIVFPGRELHYLTVKKDTQTPLDCLPDLYFYQ